MSFQGILSMREIQSEQKFKDDSIRDRCLYLLKTRICQKFV